MHVDMLSFNDGVGSGRQEKGDLYSQEKERALKMLDRLFYTTVLKRGPHGGEYVSFNLKDLVLQKEITVGRTKLLLDGHKIDISLAARPEDVVSGQEESVSELWEIHEEVPLGTFLVGLVDAETNKKVVVVSTEDDLDAKTLIEAVNMVQNRIQN